MCLKTKKNTLTRGEQERFGRIPRERLYGTFRTVRFVRQPNRRSSRTPNGPANDTEDDTVFFFFFRTGCGRVKRATCVGRRQFYRREKRSLRVTRTWLTECVNLRPAVPLVQAIVTRRRRRLAIRFGVRLRCVLSSGAGRDWPA